MDRQSDIQFELGAKHDELMSDPLMQSFGDIASTLHRAANIVREGHPMNIDGVGPDLLYVIAQAMRAGANTPARRAGDLEITRPCIIDGDLVVEGNLLVSTGCVVAGSVKANGIEIDESGLLAVGGQVDARAVSGAGWFVVAGDARVAYACGYYEVGMFMVRGTLHADLTVFRNHGSLIVTDASRHTFEFWDDVPDDDPDCHALRALVPPEALTDREHETTKVDTVDLLELWERGCRGDPVLIG